MGQISEDKTVLRFLSHCVLTVRFLHNGDGGQKTEDSSVLRNWNHFRPQKLVSRNTFSNGALPLKCYAKSRSKPNCNARSRFTFLFSRAPAHIHKSAQRARCNAPRQTHALRMRVQLSAAQSRTQNKALLWELVCFSSLRTGKHSQKQATRDAQGLSERAHSTERWSGFGSKQICIAPV